MDSFLRPEIREFKAACEKLQQSVKQNNGALTNGECEAMTDHIHALQTLLPHTKDDGQPLASQLASIPPIID